jgi:radical SAM family uncharacterized protein
MAKNYKQILYDEVLPRVQQPGQYAGGERNTVVKDHASVDLTVALAFPDTYAVGMSHLGLKILYHMLNGRKDIAAERVFAPWTDMEDELRARGLPLCSLETFTPLSEFDIVGFSMQYELSFTNLLNMLELGGIARLTSERTTGDPVVLGGGSISMALEPVAPFFDAILVGDAEDVLFYIADTVRDWRRTGLPRGREGLHRRLAVIPGVYVPSLYDVSYHPDGTVAGIFNLPPAPASVPKTTVLDLENAPFPTKPVVPNVEVIHDRINVEIMRGCPNQCRFCQAVQHYRPVKMRSIEKVLELADAVYRETGYEEISLTSLSTADYPGIVDLLGAIVERFDRRRVNVSLPSLRVGPNLKRLPGLTSTVRKAGLTMAPEVATDRLRGVIRKPIKNEDLLAGCRAAFEAGYKLVKFYFLIGAPTERDEDLRGIADLCEEASAMRRSVVGGRARINASISSHIPKPHTPFQWEAMNSREELWAKQEYIRSLRRSSAIKLKFHDVDVSYLEAVFSRGDRRLADALLKARARGIRMDAWHECFDIRKWDEVFRDVGLDPDWYALRPRGDDEVLPWDVIGLRIPQSHLHKENRRAHAAG